MMKKQLRNLLLYSFAVLALSFCSCGKEKLPGLNTPVTHENISISLTDVFGDDDHTYIVAEAVLSEYESVYDGKIAEIIVSGDGTGGYSWHCIGWDEEKSTQNYLICINSSDKSERKIEVRDFRSVSNPMNKLADALWVFSVDTALAKPLVQTIEVHDEILSEIKVYERALILIPSEEITAEELSSYGIAVKDGSGQESVLKANSLMAERCYFSFGCLLFEDSSDLDKSKTLVIGEKEYSVP